MDLSSHRLNVLSSCKRVAFTLAEVLITLAIVGVVVALVLPPVMSNIQQKVKEERTLNIMQKLSKATDKMAATSDLRGYGSTMDFVQQLSKHLNVIKVCANDELHKCWPTEKVITDVGEWEIKNTKTARDLNINGNNRARWLDTVGIVTSDGTAMILSYDKECAVNPDNGLTYDHATGISSSMSCISGVYDWNGGAKPNRLGKNYDVQTLGVAAGLGTSCAYETKSGLCIIGKPHYPTAVTAEQCAIMLADKDKYKIDNCLTGERVAGALWECGGYKNMFTFAELNEIAAEVYGTANPENTEGLTFNSSKSEALGLPSDSGFFVRFYNHDANSISSYYFGPSGTVPPLGTSPHRQDSWGQVLCKGD